MTDRIGMKELKRHASAVVRRAASGETIQITDRGRPVAQITALEVADGYTRLLAEGRVRLGGRHLLDHEPLPPPPGRPLGSEALAALRADER